MLRLEQIIGLATEPELAELLHRLDHDGVVEYLTLTQADTQRHRLRVLTDRGTECAIALPRTEHLSNGAVLLLEEHRAVVVRMQETQWLTLLAARCASRVATGLLRRKHALESRVRRDNPARGAAGPGGGLSRAPRPSVARRTRCPSELGGRLTTAEVLLASLQNADSFFPQWWRCVFLGTGDSHRRRLCAWRRAG